MSAPFLWVIVPALLGIILFALSDRIRWTELLGASVSALLAIAAVRLPIGGALTIGSTLIPIGQNFVVLGRQFVIHPDMSGLLAAVYAAAFLWFLVAAAIKPSRHFVPLGLVALSLLMAAVSFTPWEFVGIFLLFAILVIAVLLSPPEKPTTQGVLNFLSFNVLGVPFLLVAGALISGLASTPPGLPIVERPAVFLGLGFAFLLALFPFHAWMPRLGEETDPYAAAFVFVFLPAFVCILLLQVIDRNVWLRNSDEVFTFLRSIGVVTVIAGGFFAAFQRNIGRILGFASLIQTGLFLLAIGAGSRVSTVLFFPLLLSRSLGFLAWSAGLSVIRQRFGSLQFRNLQGVGRLLPLPSMVTILGLLSAGGLPILIGYVPIIRLYAALATFAPAAAVGMWLGTFGLLFAALRSTAVLVMLPEGADTRPRQTDESMSTRLRNMMLVAAAALLVLGGMLPSWISPIIQMIPLAFDHLRP